jgi:hypothetical protein
MMMTKAAMREAHVRTMQREGGGTRRACSCCADYRFGGARKARRVQRKVEGRAWRREVEGD